MVGKRFLAAKGALAFMHIEFVPEKHSSFHPALRTPSRRRDFYTFIELKIRSFYFKRGFTVLTDYCFSISHIFQNKPSEVQHQALLWCYNSGSILNRSLQLWHWQVS